MRGGYGSGDHGTLAQRIGSAPSGPERRAPAPAAHPSPARHCHVDGEPALLLEWRRASAGWEGRVVSLVWLDAVGWASADRWLPAGAITPA